MSNVKVKEETTIPNVVRSETESPRQHVKQSRSPVKYVEMYTSTTGSPSPRGNQRNWNNLKSQQLGSNFMMNNKACYICGSLSFTC